MIVERLQYIDTMRGFAIFFVALGHVIMYGYHTDIFSYNQILIQIYLPLFFFISGFLFKLPTFESKNNIYKFLTHKFIRFIIPTFFFILIYDCIFNYSVYDSIISGTKYGYWFTISLFEYQIIFLFITLIANQIKFKIAKILIWLIFIIISLFAAEGCIILNSMIPLTYLNLIGVGMLRFFCFFFVGTLIKRHFKLFCNWINNRVLMALVLILFTIAILINEKWNTAIMPNNGVPFVLTFELQFFLIGILGVIITFAFFYKNKYLFTQKNTFRKIFTIYW